MFIVHHKPCCCNRRGEKPLFPALRRENTIRRSSWIAPSQPASVCKLDNSQNKRGAALFSAAPDSRISQRCKNHIPSLTRKCTLYVSTQVCARIIRQDAKTTCLPVVRRHQQRVQDRLHCAAQNRRPGCIACSYACLYADRLKPPSCKQASQIRAQKTLHALLPLSLPALRTPVI